MKNPPPYNIVPAQPALMGEGVVPAPQPKSIKKYIEDQSKKAAGLRTGPLFERLNALTLEELSKELSTVVFQTLAECRVYEEAIKVKHEHIYQQRGFLPTKSANQVMLAQVMIRSILHPDVAENERYQMAIAFMGSMTHNAATIMNGYVDNAQARTINKFQKDTYKELFERLTQKTIRDLIHALFDLKWQDYLQDILDNKAERMALPVKFARLLQTELKNIQAQSRATADPDAAPTETAETDEPDAIEPKLHPPVIFVDHMLLEEGERDVRGGIDYEPGNGGPSVYYDEPRIDWLVEALAREGLDIAADTVIYKEKITEEEARRRRAYEVLEVLTPDIQVQIAVCPTKGNATFVLKDTDQYQFDGGKPIEISTLRNDPHAFIVKCFNPDQWTRQIIELAKANKDHLQEQLKHNTYWKPLYSEAVQSFAAYLREMGQLPPTQDRSIMAHGPLANKSTFSRLYGALHNGSIPELRETGVKSFTQLKEHIEVYHPELLVKPETDIAPTPEQPHEDMSFERSAEPSPTAAADIGLPTSVIFHAAAQFIMSNDRTLKPDDMLNLGTHGDIKADDISAVIELGEAYNMYRFVPAGIKPPRDLQEFLLLSGLTRVDAGQIVAADKTVIQGLIKTYG